MKEQTKQNGAMSAEELYNEIVKDVMFLGSLDAARKSCVEKIKHVLESQPEGLSDDEILKIARHRYPKLIETKYKDYDYERKYPIKVDYNINTRTAFIEGMEAYRDRVSGGVDFDNYVHKDDLYFIIRKYEKAKRIALKNNETFTLINYLSQRNQTPAES